MKRLLVLLLIPIFSLSSFGQEIDQLIKISKDLETFEIYALENGYKFYKMDEIRLTFKKVTQINPFRPEIKTEYLSVYTAGFVGKYHSTYDGVEQEKLPDIYRELKKLGFKLVNTRNISSDDDDIKWYVKEYSRGDTEEISVYIGSKNDVYELNYKH